MTASFDRRTLLAGGLAASAATLAPLGQAFAQNRRRASANAKVQGGLIGCKGMGWDNLMAMNKCAAAAPVPLCDVDAKVDRKSSDDGESVAELLVIVDSLII